MARFVAIAALEVSLSCRCGWKGCCSFKSFFGGLSFFVFVGGVAVAAGGVVVLLRCGEVFCVGGAVSAGSGRSLISWLEVAFATAATLQHSRRGAATAKKTPVPKVHTA